MSAETKTFTELEQITGLVYNLLSVLIEEFMKDHPYVERLSWYQGWPGIGRIKVLVQGTDKDSSEIWIFNLGLEQSEKLRKCMEAMDKIFKRFDNIMLEKFGSGVYVIVLPGGVIHKMKERELPSDD